MNFVLKNPRLVTLAALVAPLAARAETTVDISAITGAATSVATVGAAVFALAVGIKLYKWIRRAL